MGALKRIAVHGVAGLLPAAVWFVGCVLYFLTTAPLERFTDIRVPYNQVLMFRTLFDWYFTSGDVQFHTGGSNPMTFKVSGPSAEHLRGELCLDETFTREGPSG